MKQYINICSIYIFLWCIYNLHLHEVLSSTNFVISKIPLAINLVLSLYYFTRVNLSYDIPRYLKSLNILIFVFVIYGILAIASGKTYISAPAIGNASFIVSILRSLLPIYAFYYFCKIGYINSFNIKRYTIFLIFVYIGYYLLKGNTDSELLGVEVGETTNNISYAIVSLLPGLVLFNNKKIIYYGGISCIMIIVLMCVKRGAILIGVIVSFLLLYNEIKHTSRIGKFITILVSTILILGALFFGNSLYTENEFFQDRVNATIEGNSSGRDRLAEALVNSFINDANLFQVIFGRGANSTLEIAGNYAHNDWLEILTNQGLLGFIIFLIYWINYWIEVSSYRKNSQYRLIMSQIFIIYFLSTLFSMSYNQVTTISALLMGYCLYYGHHKSNIIN